MSAAVWEKFWNRSRQYSEVRDPREPHPDIPEGFNGFKSQMHNVPRQSFVIMLKVPSLSIFEFYVTFWHSKQAWKDHRHLTFLRTVLTLLQKFRFFYFCRICNFLFVFCFFNCKSVNNLFLISALCSMYAYSKQEFNFLSTKVSEGVDAHRAGVFKL